MSSKIGKALVAGAGISGIRAALDLAQTGYKVTLIDRAAHIGGILSQLDYQFPTNHCGMCKMLPLVQRDASSQFCLRKGLFHENIDIRLNTEISAIEGEPGNFTVSLRQRPTWVDADRCIGCGVCEDVCPVEIPDAFNEGLARRKAIYLPVPHNIPNPYVIDPVACTRCGACEKVCPTNAVQLTEDQRGKFRILVVDDELIVRDSLKEWLDDEGFFVDTAESGPQALEKLGQESFNLMLTDIKMPGMDGVELLKAAKEAYSDLSVLMMTAYATVETAVEAMKVGALDYLMKPFDPEKLIPMIVKVYEDLEASRYQQLEVGSIVLCGGTDYFNPADEKNVYGYGVNPSVVTSLEFERILSGTGPSQGKLVRPHDGKPVKKIAWFQCVGSRDIQHDADFCSSICCMYAIKEAVLAKQRGGAQLEAAIFYMDMRTFGKSFQRYRDRAQNDYGVRFERSRIHSVTSDEKTGDPVVRYVRTNGAVENETFDLVVLAVGQRPAAGTAQIAGLADIPLNPWGFVQTEAFLPAATARPGIVVGGSYAGLKDISESVVFASAASLEASRVIHSAGGGLVAEPLSETATRDVARQTPKILVALCSCGNKFSGYLDVENIARQIEQDPCVDRVVCLETTCTAAGWDELAGIAAEATPNRILIGACHPYLYISKLRELGRRINLDPALMDVVDIQSAAIAHSTNPAAPEGQSPGSGTDAAQSAEEAGGLVFDLQLCALNMGLARLKRIDPLPVPRISVARRALVVGGGIAGMHAALAIADHGYPVELVERDVKLGGNLHWLHGTIDGVRTGPLLEETVAKVEKHPNIEVHLESRISISFGQVGKFYTTVENGEGTTKTIEHGVTIIATGGHEAQTDSYGFGTSPAIITQKELESRLAADDFDAQRIGSVVMIQCVDSRQEPRNYCSRVCCPTSLKHALALKEKNPDIAVYILYRDMMALGFVESYFTRARQAGVIFIQYDPADRPQVSAAQGTDDRVVVGAVDPLLARPVQIEADLLVLATGIIPELPAQLAAAFGIDTDPDGFFAVADSKWRPVDALKEGVFACGLALSPRSVPEAIATAGAAAQRALRILAHEKLSAGKVVASVRESLCSLCERCIETCPYGARSLDTGREKVLVNPAMCQGCGDCAAICPNGAAVLEGFRQEQMYDVIDAALF